MRTSKVTSYLVVQRVGRFKRQSKDRQIQKRNKGEKQQLQSYLGEEERDERTDDGHEKEMQKIGQEKHLEIVIDLDHFEVNKFELFDQFVQFVVVNRTLQLRDLFGYVVELFNEKLGDRHKEEVQRVDHVKKRTQAEVVVDYVKSLDYDVGEQVHVILDKEQDQNNFELEGVL